ncbi:hypothetical protein T10_9634 [Trichinella papuae]|uniref:Uncharacterized protein n=1 Tax=Trichinella papuae TaxID=268474 RepID=A0A0V1N7C6_9BILA|nr:hypothetical protein T10_9634 [Trichinella papuae]
MVENVNAYYGDSYIGEDKRPAPSWELAGYKLTAALVSVEKRWLDVLSIVYRQWLGVSGDTTADSLVCRCRFPMNRVGRNFGLSYLNALIETRWSPLVIGAWGWGKPAWSVWE